MHREGNAGLSHLSIYTHQDFFATNVRKGGQTWLGKRVALSLEFHNIISLSLLLYLSHEGEGAEVTSHHPTQQESRVGLRMPLQMWM
mmetsp:Transcript_13450/g.22528  ORF Transcript_13450/g.22528 Transcript_13450/m.22528 type:complete len:87 (+) Transcript_13450:238-498(+)